MIDLAQTGFRKSIGTEVNILRIVGEIQHNMKIKNKGTTWTLFIDLKSAFDKVDHRIMIRKLKIIGIEYTLINTIEWLYEQTKIKVG